MAGGGGDLVGLGLERGSRRRCIPGGARRRRELEEAGVGVGGVAGAKRLLAGGATTAAVGG